MAQKIAKRKPTMASLCHSAGEQLVERLRDELEIAAQEVDYLNDACDELRKYGRDISPVHRYRARALERKKDLQQRLENVLWLQEMLGKK
jgi:hypothetical protein